jgi:4-phytase/acid phosphatase
VLRDLLKMIVRRKTPARVMLCAAVGLGTLISEAIAAEYTLERVVLVSRHGVRSPTSSANLAKFTSQKWPQWPVGDACLTPYGKTLASRMGEYYRAAFAESGLLPAVGRPLPANQVFVLADLDQRTQETGKGLLDGIFSSPKQEQRKQAKQKQLPQEVACKDANSDALFHPVRVGICEFVKKDGETAILNQAGGSLEGALKPYDGVVQQLQSILCGAQDIGCALKTEKSALDVEPRNASLKGPISIGSTVSEVFLLEYAQRMPKVAWGRVSKPDQIIALLKLHDLQFNLMQRTPYVARRQGSALLHQILETLRQTADGQSDARRQVSPDAKLVIYVGHDTNLANLGGTLDVHWQLGNYVLDETPPAGAMTFELLREKRSGKPFVRMAYYSQSLDQMRKGTRLRTSGPGGIATPYAAEIKIPSRFCAQPQDGACPWPEFYRQVTDTALINACIPAK